MCDRPIRVISDQADSSVAGIQGCDLKSTLAYVLDQISRVLAADETTGVTSFPQRNSQREAAHDVSTSDLQRSVGAESDVHA